MIKNFHKLLTQKTVDMNNIASMLHSADFFSLLYRRQKDCIFTARMFLKWHKIYYIFKQKKLWGIQNFFYNYFHLLFVYFVTKAHV